MKINLLKAGGDPGPGGTGAYDVAYPDRLEARIGGYPGPYFAITWEGDRLIWTGRGQEFPEQRKVCRPRASSWERFWDLLDETGAWDWPEDCGCFGMDGTTWSVEIAHGGRVLRSGGVNAWPGSAGIEDRETREFRRVRQGLSRLVGKKPFR